MDGDLSKYKLSSEDSDFIYGWVISRLVPAKKIRKFINDPIKFFEDSDNFFMKKIFLFINKLTD